MSPAALKIKGKTKNFISRLTDMWEEKFIRLKENCLFRVFFWWTWSKKISYYEHRFFILFPALKSRSFTFQLFLKKSRNILFLNSVNIYFSFFYTF